MLGYVCLLKPNIKEHGLSPIPYLFLFLLLFFFCIFEQFMLQIYLKNLFVISVYWLSIVLLLCHQKEAEAGSAEEQPARNIAGYLSINNISSGGFNFK